MIKEKNILLFDLDGTLTDPGEGITRSVEYALGHFGIQVADRKSLYCFIGPPLIPAFEEFYGFSREDAKKALVFYRERFSRIGLFENKVYPGIEALLSSLVSAGKTLAVATSKPEVFSLRILERFGLSGYFQVITGSELDGTRVQKDEVIETTLQRLGAERQNAVMIGDRKHDILGAKQTGISSVGVLYGYGDRAELTEAGADFIAEDVAALSEILT